MNYGTEAVVEWHPGPLSATASLRPLENDVSGDPRMLYSLLELPAIRCVIVANLLQIDS